MHQDVDHLHLDRLRALARLAGGLSADLGPLVDDALAGLRLVEARTTLAPEAAEPLAEAREALVRAAAITRQLAGFGRETAVRARPVSLEAVVGRLRPVIARLVGPYIDLDVRAAEPAAWLLADGGDLEQVLLHLVVNARDAMPLGGSLVIESTVRDLVEPAVHRFGIVPPGRWSVLTVRDSGAGMPPEALAHLFEPYHTTKGPGMGSGLGLATVFGAATRAGGQVAVTTAEGDGTTVEVWFPWHRTHDTDAALPEAVLVVDDDAWMRTVAGRALRREGFGVLEASQGSEALALLRDVAGQHVGVMLTDLRMPGLDGVALAEVVRRERPGVRIVAMTGAAPDGQELVLDPALPLLRKPFSRAALLAAIAAA
ncbi:MAG TPA: ATP-binding protein [Gemmatimonadales bacterium]|nr:ATP-binding protein [Gemmatimonadales bacterium]